MNRVGDRRWLSYQIGSSRAFEDRKMQLDDKIVIITGASSGIGAAAALMFAAEGANVVLGARREALLDELVGQITGAMEWRSRRPVTS